MFTGLIQTSGKVISLRPLKEGARLWIASQTPLKKVARGESIAVDGCCLTVTRYEGGKLQFDLLPETLQKTTISHYRPGRTVNLERALKVSDRFGGHLVLGHVDEVGSIVSLEEGKDFLEIAISHSKRLSPYLVEKGSIAVDGISLTLSLSSPRRFKVYIIPHTRKMTNLQEKKAGDFVNLEADILGKYVERLISVNRR